VLITSKQLYMSFRLVPKSLTLNDLERRNGRYFALFHRARVRYRRKQLPRFQNLLLVVMHIKTICAIIRLLVGQNKVITRFHGRRCIGDCLCA